MSVCRVWLLLRKSTGNGEVVIQKLFLASLLSVLSCVTVADVGPSSPPFELDEHHSNVYEWFLIEGFWVQVRFPTSMDTQELRHYTRTIVRLSHQLQRAKALLPHDSVAKLQTTVYIFLKDDCSTDGAVGYFRQGEDDGGQSWITLECFEFVSSVLLPGNQSDSRINGNDVWSNQTLMIHELAHAWHDRFMKDGEDNDTIKAFYRHAKQCYGNADDPYYWEEDETEFFADFTGMYFLGHWDYPRTLYKMPFTFREMIRRSWSGEHDCTGCESKLGECVYL